MVEYYKINVRLSNIQVSKLKTAVKNNDRTTLRITAKMSNSDNLPHELFLTTRQITKLRNAIEKNMPTDIKQYKAQISKIIQSGGFFGKFPGPLLKAGLPLLKSVIKRLGLLGLTAARLAIDAGVQKKYMVLDQQL